MKNTTEFLRRIGPWAIFVPQTVVLVAAGAAICAISDIYEKVRENI